MKKISLLLLSMCFIINLAQSQLNDNYLGIGAGYNLLTFKGDLNSESKDNRFNNFRNAFDINIEKRFNSFIGVNANFLYGKLSQQDFKNNSGLNFESKAINFNVKAIAYFDNDLILNKDFTFTPYISLGVGMLMFDPYGDLTDANGNTYYFWSDGSIMDLPENDENASGATLLKRDYEYETQLASSQSALNIPISFGVTAKLNKNLGFRVEAGYNFTTSDKIDNIVAGGKDKYTVSRVGLIYSLNTSKKEGEENSEHHLHFDFDFLHKHDADSDGVADFHDHCQHTPEGVEVDNKGCPVDKDNDMVPDYLDKELDTQPGAHVDENGVTMTDEHFLHHHLEKDSVMVMNRIKQLNEAPDLETLQAIDKEVAKKGLESGTKYNLPEEFKGADTNGDNIIQSQEMLHAIDAFLDGELDITITTLYNLIDYFFEQ